MLIQTRRQIQYSTHDVKWVHVVTNKGNSSVNPKCPNCLNREELWVPTINLNITNISQFEISVLRLKYMVMTSQTMAGDITYILLGKGNDYVHRWDSIANAQQGDYFYKFLITMR